MDLPSHDLAHELPEHLEKMHVLKASDAHVARPSAEYDKNNHAIALYGLGDSVISGSGSDEALEELKKKRLHTKDQIDSSFLAV